MQFDFNNHLNSEILQQNRLKARSYFIPYETNAATAGNMAGTKKRRDAYYVGEKLSCVIDVAVRRELVIDECVGAARRRSPAHPGS